MNSSHNSVVLCIQLLRYYCVFCSHKSNSLFDFGTFILAAREREDRDHQKVEGRVVTRYVRGANPLLGDLRVGSTVRATSPRAATSSAGILAQIHVLEQATRKPDDPLQQLITKPYKCDFLINYCYTYES